MVVGCFLHFDVLGSGDSISSAEERPDEDSELKLESEPEELSLGSPLDLVPCAEALVFGALLVACGDSIPSGLDKPLCSSRLVTRERTLLPASSAASANIRSSLVSPTSLGLVAVTGGDSKTSVFLFLEAGDVAGLSS